MTAGLPQQVQDQLKQLDDLQQQLAGVMQQVAQYRGQLEELKRTVMALDEVDADTPVYRSVGAVLIKLRDPATLKSEMEDRTETLEVRLKGLEKQEAPLKERIQVLQERIRTAMGGGPVPRAG